MTTAAQTSARSARRAPANVEAAMKAGEKAPTPRVRKNEGTQVYVKALQGAEAFHRKAFFVEMAVNLVFFSQAGEADKKTRATVRPIYEKAGYDCRTGKGEDYKTVQRRTDVAAKLFTWLGGQETIESWTEAAKPAEAIPLVAARLEKDKLDSIQAIRAKVDAERVQKERERQAALRVQAAAQATQAAPAPALVSAPAQAQAPASPAPQEPPKTDVLPQTDMEKQMMADAAQASDQREASGSPAPVAPVGRRLLDRLPSERVIRTAHIVVGIPDDATQEEVMEVAGKLLSFAQHMLTTPVH
jgi:hypothetical protein